MVVTFPYFFIEVLNNDNIHTITSISEIHIASTKNIHFMYIFFPDSFFMNIYIPNNHYRNLQTTYFSDNIFISKS